MDTAATPGSGSAHDRASSGGDFDPSRGVVVAGPIRARGPVVTGLAVWGMSYAALAVLIVGLGFLLTHLLLPAGMDRFDLSVSRWFVDQRTPMLNTVTLVGSELGSTPAILGVAVVAVLVLAIMRRWYEIAFVVGALALEFSVFLTATFLIDRNRPDVPRLDPSPVTSSYPSGHAAASFALYAAIAIVIASHVRSAIVRTLVWIVALAVPVLVALSRVYRGMHHLTDVTASLLLGPGAVLLALLVTRAAAAAAAPNEETVPEPAPAPDDIEVAS
ncbi:MAG TPA: phosphatase PAP2 family protein [Actinomycetota bacterium]|nr:phosphatase PAP2 family protein [Actinomycetota bacterium]